MVELIITQETIRRSYELWEDGGQNLAAICPMAIQMAKFLNLEEQHFHWGIDRGCSEDKVLHYESTNADERIGHPFDRSVCINSLPRLVGPITVDIEKQLKVAP